MWGYHEWLDSFNSSTDRVYNYERWSLWSWFHSIDCYFNYLFVHGFFSEQLMSICLSIWLKANPSVSLPLCLSLSLSIYLSLYLSIYVSVYLLVHNTDNPFACLWTCPSVFRCVTHNILKMVSSVFNSSLLCPMYIFSAHGAFGQAHANSYFKSEMKYSLKWSIQFN